MPDNQVDSKTGGDALEPRVEHVAGVSLPYRGLVDHGVAPEKQPTIEEATHWQGRPVVYETEPPEPEPIPVRVVRGETAREVRAFAVSSMPITQGQPQQIAARDTHRQTIKVLNPVGSPAVVMLAPDNGVSAIYGYPLVAGDFYIFSTTEPIWAFTASANVIVDLLWEYTKEYK